MFGKQEMLINVESVNAKVQFRINLAALEVDNCLIVQRTVYTCVPDPCMVGLNVESKEMSRYY